MIQLNINIKLDEVCGQCLYFNNDFKCEVTGIEHDESDRCDCGSFELYLGSIEENY